MPTPAHIDCAERCEIPAGVELVDVPRPRHAWSDVALCPHEGCERCFLIVKRPAEEPQPDRACPGCRQLDERRIEIEERAREGKTVKYSLATLNRARRDHRPECLTPTEDCHEDDHQDDPADGVPDELDGQDDNLAPWPDDVIVVNGEVYRGEVTYERIEKRPTADRATQVPPDLGSTPRAEESEPERPVCRCGHAEAVHDGFRPPDSRIASTACGACFGCNAYHRASPVRPVDADAIQADTTEAGGR